MSQPVSIWDQTVNDFVSRNPLHRRVPPNEPGLTCRYFVPIDENDKIVFDSTYVGEGSRIVDWKVVDSEDYELSLANYLWLRDRKVTH